MEFHGKILKWFGWNDKQGNIAWREEDLGEVVFRSRLREERGKETREFDWGQQVESS